MEPTVTFRSLPFRSADFPSLAAALEYAAQDKTGMNFYNGRGELGQVLPYTQLHE